ncbi:hypothetical protein [Embleya sp. AB8]|uniref:hypothetical protein n=1 Tax=Embleya sp. AB8 TaxID=3156304 RepID=UPI003C770A41
MSGQYNSPPPGQYPGYPPPGGYGQQPPPGQYGPPPGYGPPGYPQPYPPPTPPRRNRRKQVISWIAVVAGGTATTVIAALMINGTDGRKNESEKPLPTESVRKLESFDPNAVAPAPSAAASVAESRPAAPPAPKSGGRFAATTDPKTWPDACDLVTDEQIRLAVPKAGKIEKYGTIANSGKWLRENPPIRSTQCEYTVEDGALKDQLSPLKFQMQIWFAGDPAEAQSHYASELSGGQKAPEFMQFKDYTTTLGMDAALYKGNAMYMRKGGYYLQFSKSGGGGSGVDASGKFVKASDWIPTALPKVVPGIAAKI